MTVTLNPLYRFETFVVGAANRLAVTAAKAVAEAPGTVYNPLFIYARPGLGKTHLLMGVGHAARAIDPRLAVEYLTLDEFVEAFHAAIAAGQGEAYRKRFVDVDLLLVDDVQFLTHRREMQAELLRLTDALQTANRQIVLTSDRPPAEIEALDERLIRRFAGGLVIDVAAPDYETRVAILRRKAEERRAAFAEGVLEAVAGLNIDNVRELLGALNRMIAHQAVADTPLSPGEARELIGGTAERRSGATVEGSDAPIAGPPPEPEPARPTAVAADRAVADKDEFSDFLTEIHATVAQQVDAWRTQIGAAILRWQGEGYRTGRLEALLDAEVAPDADQAVHGFERDVERLRAMEAEAAELAPELAGSPAFRDPADLPAAETLLLRARSGAVPPPAPSPIWQLADLVEGASARVALQAARVVVEEPGSRYNPLVLVGGSGAGKTHLLHAVGNLLAQRCTGAVACLSAPEFTAELIDAIDRDAVSAWRHRYRRCVALLLDDVHLIGEKDRTQEELFLLFNLLVESGRQLVFTSATAPAAVAGLEPRLRTRLEGGLVVELPVPDPEVREAVVGRELSARVGVVDAELAAYLASRPADSVRVVVAQLQRVLNAAEARGAPATAALAREVLDGAVPPPPPRKPGPGRSSGIVAPTAGGARSREKTVWEWPEIGDRLLEEWR
ncbi:MAG TPA: DnaA/Hda family protein [Gemmatimonadales bacterium]|nr:DnaA/Hda family protein [Gemmatimonadales bacterium]